MAEIKNTLRISAPISPYNTDDVQPTHEAQWGKGGYRSVKTIVERNLIPDERREIGMVVYVEEDSKVYILQDGISNDNWVNFITIIEGSTTAKLFVSLDEPNNPQLEYVWLSLSNGGLYFRDPTNTYWTSITAYSVDGGEF